MHNVLLSCFLMTAWAATAFAQTQETLKFRVKTPDGVAVRNADVSVQTAETPTSVRTNVQGRQVMKFGLQAQPYRPFFVTKTNAEGLAQASKAGLQNAFPADKVLVSVRAEGFETYRQTFALAEQNTIEIVLRPLPPQQ